MVEIRQIAAVEVEDMPRQGWSTPLVDQFIDEPLSIKKDRHGRIRRKVKGTAVHISPGQGYAYLLPPTGEVDGKKVYERTRWTAYA